ncbi:pyridoxal phosphate-dependent decarboxylase family protein [Pseudonocardia hydrocarbonoxydans]|uniref:Pyridoxal-dependent decarboxylase n=1 Tax=Pseudonocardia hydrocarbonoxydans TaxID=76726 RepID=A0A4Y3WPS0_9PSEU|nr:aminotransferase class V-fold PLP-dependent enzyme [Pseudonocardia hydrocarbonoxydans]GEC20867.1 pyridoxal-dependent decarboxylase [Pseudonocardia hydrocarbonoxydans]
MTSLAHPPDQLQPTRSTPDPRSHLLDDTSLEAYRSGVADGVDRVARRIGAVDGPVTGASAAELGAVVAGIDLDRPLTPSAALDELDAIYLRDAVFFHHPRYLAHLNCPVVIPALVAETVLAAVNSSLDTVDQSMGATVIEQRLIAWTAGRIGLGEHADGVFTSGGTQSNLQALLIARERARTQTPAGTAPRRLRILASEVGHFSVVTAARLLGLGPGAVVPVACDADKRMRTDALARELRRAAARGETVMAVVATAGTTDFGSIDPLPQIADLCAATGAWLHVDAAYGCGLLVSTRRRGMLAGIERADSVTVDFHKSFFQPVSSSAVLVRDRAQLRHVTHHADYLNPARDAARPVRNQVDKSLATTRRFDALKLWLTLRTMGADGVGELFDAVVDLAAQAYQLLAADPRFEVATRPTLSTLVFRWAGPDERADAVTLHVREALFASGAAVVASTTVDGRHWLKFTVLNPRTSIEDIAEVLDLIADHARDHLARPAVLAS